MMTTATTTRTLLLSALAVLLLWRAAAPEHEPGRYGLRATIGSSEVVFTLTLPVICLQLSAQVIGELMAVSATRLCNGCETRGARRSWS